LKTENPGKLSEKPRDCAAVTTNVTLQTKQISYRKNGDAQRGIRSPPATPF